MAFYHSQSKSSITTFVAKILLPPLLILLSVLLLWIYFESEKNIHKQQDLNITLNNRNTVRELDNTQQHLTSILTDTVLALSKASVNGAFLNPEEIELILSQGNIYEFDFLRFVPVKSEHRVVVSDSPFFDFSASGELYKDGAEVFLDSWHLIDGGLPDNPIWIMLSGKRVVHGKTGLVAGTLLGGVVLNDNQALARAIQYRSVKADLAALEVEGQILVANYPLSEEMRECLKKGDDPVNRVVLAENGVNRPIIISHYKYPFPGSSDLFVILVYEDTLQLELQATFLRSGGIALFSTLVIFIVFVFFVKSRTEVALGKLLRYTETAARTPKDAVYESGPFQEFNRIGEAVAKMIALLNNTTDELQDNKERLELTIEGAALGTWDWDIKSGQLDYNEHWGEMLGYSSGELECQITAWKNLLHPDEKDSILEKLIEHLDGRTNVYQSEHRLQGKSGQWIWVLDTGRVYKRDESGEPLRAAGIHLDITRQKVAEQELIRERGLLLSLMNSIPDLIFYKNDDGVYLGCNKAFEKLVGKPEEEIVNKTDLDLFPQDVAEFFRKQDKTMLALGQSRRNDEWVTYPDGNRVLLDTLKIPFVDSDKETYGLIGVSRDVTHKKKMEEELLKIEKLESVAVLAGGIAHDFNNILTAVLGNIELASYRFAGEAKEKTELLDEAAKATRRAIKLTKQLLTFARGGELIRESTDLPALIKETAGFVLHGSKVLCDYDFQEDLWRADADSGQISQVIQNIVINAKQAMIEGGTLHIQCENVAAITGTTQESTHSGGFVKIMITDTGSGIPEENIDKIFDPYFTTKQKGNGLGLAISYSIIAKHQGVMTVESESGVGTTFTIFLPSTEDAEEQGRVFVEEENSSVQSAKILLMDDEQAVLDVVEIQLQTLGHRVEMALNGDEAIDKYRRALRGGAPFDLVMVDLTIPAGMGGEETARNILEINKDAKIVVASGYANDMILANYRDYGFQATISKPFGLAELSSMIKDVLG